MKDLNSTTLFCLGISGSFLFNVAINIVLFSRIAIVGVGHWQAAIALSLFVLLIGSTPVFGAMAIVQRRVTRQASRESTTRCLARYSFVSFLVLCCSAIWGRLVYAKQDGFFTVQIVLAIESGFVAFMLCLAISLNLVLRYFGFHRDDLRPSDSLID